MNASLRTRQPMIVATVSVAFQEQFLHRRVLITLLLLTALFTSLTAQTVTEIVTDYNGYWKSGQSAVNTVKPQNSHNMIAFKYNGTRYSTGVNDDLLTAHGDVFVEGDYKALPVHSVSAPNSNTKIGLGASYDGVPNGASNPRPANNIQLYLTDGIKGLNLGTGVANLPAGEIMFAITNIEAQLIGDGIPDLLITQIADPSGSKDSYEFTDINGNRIGNKVDITLSTLPALGNWTADFYDASTTPMSLTSGFTATDRNIRLWAADFSNFGINASNINQIVYFRIRLSGDSDVAFVAYNNKTFNLASTLPVTTPAASNTERNEAMEIKAYPNPTRQQFTVKHKQATGHEQLTIRNMQGIIVQQQKPAAGSTQTTFNIHQLPKGTYLVALTDGKKQSTEMIVKN